MTDKPFKARQQSLPSIKKIFDKWENGDIDKNKNEIEIIHQKDEENGNHR